MENIEQFFDEEEEIKNQEKIFEKSKKYEKLLQPNLYQNISSDSSENSILISKIDQLNINVENLKNEIINSKKDYDIKNHDFSTQTENCENPIQYENLKNLDVKMTTLLENFNKQIQFSNNFINEINKNNN